MATVTSGRATDFITFTRTSNATVTGADGRIRWAGHNLLTNSESFDGWTTNYGVTVTANAIAAPNGTTTADRLVEQAINDTHFIGQNDRITTPSNTLVPHTLAVFAKADQRQYLNLSIEWSTNYVAATFDLSGGTVTSNRAGGTGTGNTSTITAVGSGWYLCTLTGILGTAGSNGAVISISDVAVPTGSKASYLGNTSNGLYLWGAHLYRSDLGGMVLNPARGDAYYPTTPRNFLGFTEDFAGANWAPSNLSSLSNIAVAPNGLQTADKIYPTSNDGSMAQTASVTIASKTFSIYAKAAEFTVLCIREPGNAANGLAYISLVTGAVVNTIPATATVTAVNVGDGWYRIAVVYSSTAAGSVVRFAPSNASGAISSTASGTNGILIWGAQLSDSASLDAYSPVYGAAVTSAAYYAPRLDYDANGSALGLLVEEQRTNLATYSEAFDDAVWAGATAGIASRTANTTAAPTGTSVADTITANNALAAHYIGRSVTWTAAVHTVSVFIKYSTQQFVQLNTWDGTTARFANFDIQNGVAGTTSNATSTITSFGNGWYRCTMTGSAAQAAASGNWVICFANSNSASATPTYTTAGTEAFFVYGAQIEAGSFATSYIPTIGASTATRTADVASVSTQAFPYSETEGSVVVAYDRIGVNRYSRLFNLGDASENNQVSLLNFNVGQENAYFVTGGVAAAVVTGPSVPAVNAASKMGLAFKSGDSAISLNGASATAISSTFTPAATSLYMGGTPVSGQYLNGHIRQITYIPRRLSNSELQARTV